jgi:pyroglutamyl-peptidase
MPTLLITGFGRFPGAAFNPSARIALRTAQARRPAFDGIRRVAHVFPTSYAEVDRALPALLARHRPDGIVMFGLAARAKQIRIETRARNRTSVLFPDADGVAAERAAIVLRAPSALSGRAPFLRFLRAAKNAGAAASLSRNAGGYVCNYAYWRGLEAAAKPRGPRLVVFVHVPRIGSRRAAMRWPDALRAAEAIVLAAANALRPGGTLEARSPFH